MKKYLLILICLIQVVFLHAANRYWVGGTGSWNSSSHWAESSSGTPGVSAPGINDDVFFDQNSFPDDNSSITISGTVQCNNFTFSDGTIANLTGTVNDKIEIAGSLNVIGALQNNFPGEISFVGSGNKIINFKYASPKGNVTFNGPASTWTFQSNLLLPLSSSVVLQSGNLIASNRFIQAASIDFSGSLNKSIDISNSHLILRNALQTTTAVNLSATQTGSTVYLRSYSGGTPGVLAIDSIHVIIVPPQCNTSCDGTVTVTTFPLAGGPYTYDWTGGGLPPGTTGNPLSSVCGGVYLLTVTDLSDGDQLQQFVTVIPPNPIGVTFVKKKPKCFGQCNGTITANTIGGTLPYSWLWSDGQTTQTAVGLCVGAYNVTVTDAHGCTQTFSTILTQPSAVNPNATFTSLNCSGVCTGTASTAASGGNTPTPYTYSWAPGGATTPSIAGLCAGSYTVTVKDDSLCVGTATVTITSPPPIVIIPVSTNISCFGACDGTAGVGPVSGGVPPYTYTWTPAVSVGPSASGLCPGAYSVVVKDANGCTANAAFNITQPATLTVVATGVNVTCFGVCNGSVTATVSGGTSPFTYTWTPGPGSVTTASVTNTLSSQCAGVYTINVTDSHGCTASANITITEPPVLLANAVGTNVLCNGACNGTITSTPTGGNPGYTYAWTGPAGFTATTATISGLCPGTYNVTVTDTKGCTSFQSVVITQPPVITTGLTFTNVSCNGACNGTATSSPSGGVGGYTFSWTGPAGFTATTAAISGLCPGVYNVVVTDANGCTKPGSVTITQPNVLAVSIVATALSCNGDCNATATATITGGIPPYTIDWLPGSPVGDGTTTISSLCAGTYTINVTDANGCPATATVTITQPTALNLTGATTNISCFGLCNGSAAAIGGGGTPAYSYSWAPGGQTTSSISAQCAGSYTVTLTDSKLCTKKDTLVIIEPAQLLGNPSVVTNISCAGVVPCDGSATSAATGGTGAYIYDWTPGSPAGDGTPTVTGLCAGTYNLIVTDANLCTSTMPVTITQPAVLSAPITGSTSSCNICNGTATVTPAGGTPPYSYLWAPGGQTTPTAIGLCPNVTYTVTVTDSHGCTATGTVTILQTIIINITTSNSTLSCFGACDGVATANASGGTIPYSYIWTGPMCGGPTGIVSLTQTAVGLGAGTYTVSVSDAAGCFNTDTVVFINPPLLTVTTTHTDLT
ncbi:MAG: hypothetical protein ACXVPU_05390, partial [Bacteroidia bacterium]